MPVISNAIVELDDVDFAYDSRPILQGIRMRFPRGRVVAIMGGSGCGKTTILRLIGGQVRPVRGTVTINSTPVDALSHSGLYAMRRRMGMRVISIMA